MAAFGVREVYCCRFVRGGITRGFANSDVRTVGFAPVPCFDPYVISLLILLRRPEMIPVKFKFFFIFCDLRTPRPTVDLAETSEGYSPA